LLADDLQISYCGCYNTFDNYILMRYL